MVTEREVLDYLSVLMRWEPGETEGFRAFARDAAAEVNRRVRVPPGPGDNRLVRAAAGWAAYQIALSSGGEDVTSFRAGDLSVSSKDAAGTKQARQRMEQYFAEAAELLHDDRFLFMEV